MIANDFLQQPGLTTSPRWHGHVWLPVLHDIVGQPLIYFGFVFLLGTLAYLYRDRVPIHPALAVAAAVALIGSMRVGGFYVVGLPAMAYLMIWAACSLPRWTHPIGRRHDYSYGIYIYGWPVQQMIALLSGARYGVVAYVALSLAGAAVLTAASWHLIERPALSLKNWSPTRKRDDSTSIHGQTHSLPENPASTDPTSPAVMPVSAGVREGN